MSKAINEDASVRNLLALAREVLQKLSLVSAKRNASGIELLTRQILIYLGDSSMEPMLALSAESVQFIIRKGTVDFPQCDTRGAFSCKK